MMRIRISHLVNSLTRQALYESVSGYVGKEVDFAALEERVQREYGQSSLHRFDLGENADGCTPCIHAFLTNLSELDQRRYLSGYPESPQRLKMALSGLHRVPSDWIALGTGVVSFLSIICHTFYEWGDRVLLPTPTFFVIEEYTLRSGALPIYMPIEYRGQFAWTPGMTAQVVHQIQCVPVKMLWLCSPNNPTGQPIPMQEIEEMVQAAEESFTMVVVDEAYGEYTDDIPEYASATRLLCRYENLIVLRSFSKAYGLAGMRIGYAMMSSNVVHDAVARQMEYFPVTRLSIELACVAVADQDYITVTRVSARERFHALSRILDTIEGVEYIPTACNIFLLRRRETSTLQLKERLLRKGVLVADADMEGLHGQGWVRITCRKTEDNLILVQALQDL